MRSAVIMLITHIVALTFGLAGMLIALPNPGLWAGSPLGVQVFTFGMKYSGSVQIISGAAAAFALGVAWIGWRRTLIFLGLSAALSLGMELLGTGTGWPFGAYEYTDGLGLKIGDRVPFTIPLSWFTVGLSSYLIGITLASRRATSSFWIPVVVGVWLLTVWDLVLDPAMAHESLPLRFWTWHQTGPYFGMPVQNFLGWSATGALFMTLSAIAWRTPPPTNQFGANLAFAVYLANVVFAAVLSLSVGLWEPVLLAIVLGVVPAAIILTLPSSTQVPLPRRSWSPSDS